MPRLLGLAPMIPATWLPKPQQEITGEAKQTNVPCPLHLCDGTMMSKSARVADFYVLIQRIVIGRGIILSIESVADEVIASNNFESGTEAFSKKWVVIVDALPKFS
jgi:hypothetical protein